MRVHNKMELLALVKEAIQNGTIFEMENRTIMSHSQDHIADLLIEKDGSIVLRSYPIMGQTNFEVVGKISRLYSFVIY